MKIKKNKESEGIYMSNAEEVRKLKRSEYATFLDTTPTEDAETYTRMGKGISEMEDSYNPEIGRAHV